MKIKREALLVILDYYYKDAKSNEKGESIRNTVKKPVKKEGSTKKVAVLIWN